MKNAYNLGLSIIKHHYDVLLVLSYGEKEKAVKLFSTKNSLTFRRADRLNKNILLTKKFIIWLGLNKFDFLHVSYMEEPQIGGYYKKDRIKKYLTLSFLIINFTVTW